MKTALEILLVLLALAFVWQLIWWGWREFRRSVVTDRDEQQRMPDGAAADFARFEPPVCGAGEDEGWIHGATVTGGER